ncbi:MAG: hypothetical protein P4N59_07410 [Negativicutes bacterium]|nr:hypothetical protein [Negativicutes bacterium]
MFESDKTVTFSEEDLVKMCREWQEVLQLEFWEVAVRIARAHEMKLEGQAEVTWVLQKACAKLTMLDPVDYPEGPFKQDMEISLVHELLHLHFAAVDNFETSSLECKMMERAVDHIAKALVKLKRKAVPHMSDCAVHNEPAYPKGPCDCR